MTIKKVIKENNDLERKEVVLDPTDNEVEGDSSKKIEETLRKIKEAKRLKMKEAEGDAKEDEAEVAAADAPVDPEAAETEVEVDAEVPADEDEVS